ncbi:hypothetical protein V6K52_10755 [Knoellia sp. S7-12]|uniref:hypothetical protein n=1 Tax=Knoellia sp. S7-12 TaxID=3126698 RepID=UPI003366A927
MTTTPELESALRQLFLDHEHLADIEVPERLAADAARRAQSHHRQRLILGLAAVVLLIAGAVGAQQLRGSQAQRDPALPASLPSGPLGDALRTFENSWAAAQPPRLTLLGPQLPQVRGTTDDDYVPTLKAGFAVGPNVLPTTKPADSLVRWQNGAEVGVPVMSAADTLAALRSASGKLFDPCPDCVPRRVTSATLMTTGILTPQGDAVVPAWEFVLEGTPATVVMWAVPATHTVTPAEMPESLVTETVNSVVPSDDGRELTLEFAGESPDCPLTYTASAARSAHAVSVLIEPHGDRCSGPDAQHSRHVTVRLDRPLGEALVIDATLGNPTLVKR